MKKSLKTSGLLLALVLFSFGYALAAGHTRINGEELQKMMKEGSHMVIVDVREPDLYSKAHIPGAINIPYDDAKPRILKELKPSDRIVFVCHGGPMGDELSEILTKNGYAKVYNLIGGMRKWQGPVTK